MTSNIYSDKVKKFYNHSYMTMGFGAQRRYPNEELCRFMGRNFFSQPMKARQDIKILEVGCGSGANLWMLAKEGFSSYGIDLSKESLVLCREMLNTYGVKAELSVQDMSCLSFDNEMFHAVVDVFSSYCLTRDQGNSFLTCVSKVLKKGGKFFSYFPSKKSDAFIRKGTSHLIDEDTLNAISRESSAFSGQNYPFRFLHPQQYRELLQTHGLEVRYLEKLGRTYHFGEEYFEFIVVEAVKI